MENTVNERIKFLLDSRAKGNKAAFARLVGVTGQAIADLTEGRKGSPSFTLLQNIIKTYPDINSDWLILGTGEMLKNQKSEPTSLHSGKATVEYATELASNGLLREVIDSQAKTIATQDTALSTKDKVIALLEEELKKFGGSSYAALLELLPQLLPTGAAQALVTVG